MAEFFGDVERVVADLYPYRWVISVGLLFGLAAVGFVAYRREWHAVLWRRKRPLAIVGTPLLALAIFVAWDLGSPLFTNKTVEEEFPFAFAAVVPVDMSRKAVDDTMAVIAKMDRDPVDEAMPQMMPEEKGSETGAEEEKAEGETPQAAVKLKSGEFRDQDGFHRGSGQAAVYRGPDGSYVLRIEEFKVTNGPDLHILLASHADPRRRDDLDGPGYIDLGQLKGNIGSQNYPLPDDLSLADHRSVVIYCKPFHVIFSVAPLQDES